DRHAVQHLIIGQSVLLGGLGSATRLRHSDQHLRILPCRQPALNCRTPVAQRLVADGETVLDVPAKLSARARVFATGQGRKSDPVDAYSVAVVALRTSGLRQVLVDDTTVALRLLVDRRDQLG